MKLRKYKKLPRAEIDAIFARMPAVPANRMLELEERFPVYIYYDVGHKERLIECSRCGGLDDLPTDRASRKDYPEGVAELATGKPGDAVICPFCGRPAELKCGGRLKNRRSLDLTARVIFFMPASRNEIYARSAFVRQSFEASRQEDLTYTWREDFYFTPGLALGRRRDGTLMGSISNPFKYGLGAECSWLAIGMEDCENTFFAWWPHEEFYSAGADVWEPMRISSDLLEYIAGFSEYPQCERLAKMGLVRLAGDRVFQDNGHGLRWAEQDTRKLLGLNRAELRDWIDTGGDPQTLESYRALRRLGIRADISTARNVSRYSLNGLEKGAKAIGAAPKELWRYLEKTSLRTGCHCGGYGHATMSGKIGLYEDYVDMARAGGLELYRDDQKYPKDLQAAHDAAMEARDRAEEARRVREDAENEAAYAPKVQELVDRYEVRDKTWCVLAPRTLTEIRTEGQRMGHCVGGYTHRHLAGDTVILFMRKKEEPEKCLYTLEVDPKTGRLRQARARHNGQLAPAAETWLTRYIEGLQQQVREKGA